MEIYDPGNPGNPNVSPIILPEHTHYTISGADPVTTRYDWGVIIRQSITYDFFVLHYDVILADQGGTLRMQNEHPQFALSFVLGNSLSAFKGTKAKVDLKNGQYLLLFIPQGQYDTNFPAGEYRFIRLEVPETFLQQFLFNAADGKDTHTCDNKPYEMAGIPVAMPIIHLSLVDSILHNELKGVQGSISREVAVKKLLLFSLRDIQEQFTHAKSEGFKDLLRFEEIKAYIIAHLKDVDTTQICDLFKIGRTSLYSGFVRIYHMNLRDFILQQKIDKAKLMLEQNVSIPDVSKALGYLDSTNFIRIFKKRTGTTPAQYRSANSRTK